ncbi:uncharacterized protein LOC109518520 [Hippocampus comes]|uniref:uncharacterized protein LOC109518520 n=1 Tax=Hippocampus comes TaxID=109280 RepID=UPI00094E87D9|nr:PREDICTED: uncharacterized protein LOC109518520 [Hippocampus comes]
MRDYGRIRDLCRTRELLAAAPIHLFAVNHRTLTQWHNRRSKQDSVQAMCVAIPGPSSRSTAAEALAEAKPLLDQQPRGEAAFGHPMETGGTAVTHRGPILPDLFQALPTPEGEQRSTPSPSASPGASTSAPATSSGSTPPSGKGGQNVATRARLPKSGPAPLRRLLPAPPDDSPPAPTTKGDEVSIPSSAASAQPDMPSLEQQEVSIPSSAASAQPDMPSLEQQEVSIPSSAASAQPDMPSMEQQEVSIPSSAASAPTICVECRGKCDTCGGLIAYRRTRRRNRASGEPRPGGSGDAPGPARCTVHRRKTRALRDQQLLDANEQYTWGSKPGEDCVLCGQPRTLAGGHAFYKGSYFCQMNEHSSVSVTAWLQQQSSAMPQQPPCTTAWRQRKGGTSEQQQEAARKIRTCGKCGLPQQAVYGHSSFMTKVPNRSLLTFCTLHEGKPLALWLAEMRARENDLTRPQQQLSVDLTQPHPQQQLAVAAAAATQDTKSPQQQQQVAAATQDTKSP